MPVNALGMSDMTMTACVYICTWPITSLQHQRDLGGNINVIIAEGEAYQIRLWPVMPEREIMFVNRTGHTLTLGQNHEPLKTLDPFEVVTWTGEEWLDEGAIKTAPPFDILQST
ncbi:MAG: hypothetical protein ACR2QF_03130 [Geminicoccaceae bacterium]